MKKINLGILVSGRGSNMEAIINACKDDSFPAVVKAVVSDNENAKALQTASNNNIPNKVLIRKNYTDKVSYETDIVKFLKENDVNLVCLAGFMKIVGKTLLEAFPNKVLNIHPSLLPAFPGLEAQKQALEYGVKFSGCTVHFVDEKMDHGSIILQECVPVKDDDTFESLSKRILEKEHEAYPKAIKYFAKGLLRIDGRKVYIRE